ncbi:type II secretion system protein GspM [Pseudoxanthomonas winnipegensis]|uniref:General secretion pathway protein GspM n=1 Tax=Pseudoxanthomonas winnipegensis TaxID=2480810 RepID=A0A4V2HEK2_9GAMM|nr:type II secretion system protein GspM [Pseudoxanthomonas winnipegensis]RZZ89415.1 general secretion pathway protein GspM [Pseudoxanthomonas winnipegensis]TAA33142.1 general secretion pathway protein GspM [Pseudoxanthomonas winnipegensis]TAA44284.1 general secretion pathway protein GspM [Pseudoxanthomonas winnipegensis]TBV78373.1 general secretion pathway protein GspM [Pseudoxanthomonas winnipegensis]
MRARSERQDRWLALGLLLAALALAYLVLVHPWWTVPMRALDARIDAARERELRVRTQLAQRPLVARQLAAAQAALGNRPGFLAEPTAELATAALTQRLETVVAQASPGNRSCAITNRSPVPQQGTERFTRVTVQVTLRCGVDQTAAVLHALESGSPRLFVDNLNILAQTFNLRAPGAEDQNAGLNVSFDLYGYLKPAAQAAAPVAGGVRAQ